MPALRTSVQQQCSSYDDELTRFGWRQRTLSGRKCSHDSGYDSDGSACSFVSAHSTKSEPILDQAGSPRNRRSRRSLRWLGTTMKETAVKSVNYLPGAECLPSYQCLPSRQTEQDRIKEKQEVRSEKQEPVVTRSTQGLHRRVASAPAEMATKEEHETSTSKTFGSDPPFCTIKVSSKPSDKDVKIVRFIALQECKKLPEDTATQLTNFLSDLLDPSQFPFEFVYDLRALPVPKLHMIVHLAKWGGEAKRRDYFIKRCVGCRIILSPGLMFSVTKASCLAFFKVCPPTCNTYLMTDDSEPGPDTHFFPPPKAVVEMREREAKKRMNPQTQSAEEVTLSEANPQDPELHEDIVVHQPAGCLSWFTGRAHEICTQSAGPGECFSFLTAFTKPTKRSTDGVNQLAKLSQTIVDQQKTIDVLTKRIVALESGDKGTRSAINIK